MTPGKRACRHWWGGPPGPGMGVITPWRAFYSVADATVAADSLAALRAYAAFMTRRWTSFARCAAVAGFLAGLAAGLAVGLMPPAVSALIRREANLLVKRVQSVHAMVTAHPATTCEKKKTATRRSHASGARPR